VSQIIVKIAPLDPTFDRGAFRCGNDFIDRYVKKRCLGDHALHKLRAYVATQPDTPTVIGFYTLSLTSLKPGETSPAEAQEKFKSWAIPLVYLGQIGVQEEYQRKHGIGSALMTHAFEQTLRIADIAGTYGMMLDADNDEVAAFYEGWGFFRFGAGEEEQIKMICPLTKIREALEVA